MKEKITVGILTFLIILIIVFVMLFNNYLIKYDNISKTINKDIKLKEEKIKLNNEKLDKIKKENDLKYKNVKNMDNYINLLEERVKQYE